MIRHQDVTEAGKLLKPHGYKGEINAVSDYPAEIYDRPELPVIIEIDGILTPFFLNSVRGKGADGLLFRFDGIDSDTKARSIVNHTFYLRRSDAAEFLGITEAELDEDIEELTGYEVTDTAAGPIGTVESMEPGVEYDYLNVRTPGGAEVMVPLIDAVLEEIDDDTREIRVSLPEGMLSTFAPGEFDDPEAESDL